MTSQRSSWLDRYLEEKHALPQDVEQFLLGSTSFANALTRLVAQKKAVPNIEDRLKCDRIPMPSEIDALEQALQRNEELQQENEELRVAKKEFMQENSRLRQEIRELRARGAVVPGVLSPAERETARWLQEELPWWVKESTTKQRRKPVAVPIFAVRFTHRFVNASLAFGEEHGNAQENILKLYEQLFRGRVELSEIEPLVVKLPETCEDDFGIRSRNNRRLLALRMLQSSRLDECLKVPCYIKSHQDYERDPKFREWFDHGDDRTSGWSIRSREGKSKHRGVAMFNNADAAVKGLENLLRRASKQDLPNEHGISHVEALLKLIKRRPVAPGCGDDDEETLTFVSVEDHGARGNAVGNGWWGPVPGGRSWGYGNWHRTMAIETSLESLDKATPRKWGWAKPWCLTQSICAGLWATWKNMFFFSSGVSAPRIS